MFCNFNEIFFPTPEQKEAEKQVLIKSAEKNQSAFLGKCATCKHQIYKPTFDHNTMDDFKSLYCGLREDTYRITSFSTCENYEEKPLDDVLEEINRSFEK